jgi:hypothetical protein
MLRGRKLNSKAFWLFIILALTSAIATDSFYLRRAVPNVSAVESAGSIGIYWDKNCSQRVSSIGWSVLSPGQVKDTIIYVRNEGNESIILVETATNWNPAGASQYLVFSWNCQNEELKAGTVVNVTQELSVSLNIQGISQFSFAITVEGRQYSQGDVNKDGSVDMADISIMVDAFMSVPGSPNWNPAADLNSDGTVDPLDIAIVVRDFGKSNT